jgi:hypothetical protein
MELVRPDRLDQGDLERADDDVPRAVPLHVQERIGDAERNLVAELGRAHGVGVDEDVGHAGTLTPWVSFQAWPTR